ncbi:hypothetical protein HYC85_027041 [Camellia sinensis]|uniref:Dolichyl-diphosphooligosaccharide--protein glycosyltransferase subunit DAD1 n=1 Tax=Camellia sinensis TaxID=4442 RepID=A0A7J7G5A3_CAMSI|nr:hypothetical protein HYC85_027041 [Camellia sinensis]
MGKSSTTKDAQALFQSLRSAYSATPTNLKIIDLYVMFAVFTALIQLEIWIAQSRDPETIPPIPTTLLRSHHDPDLESIQNASRIECCILGRRIVVYMAVVGSFPFNSFLSGVLSCVGTAVLAICLRIQVNKENKEFKDLPPERAFADFVLCNLVLHLVIMNFLG